MDGVSVVIRKHGRFLMVQQARGKPFPLKWLAVSGKALPGESLEQASLREAMEEVGLEVEVLKKMATLDADYGVESLHFMAADWKSGEVRPDSKEIEDYGWFTYDEVLNLDLMKATREFFEAHFRPL